MRSLLFVVLALACVAIFTSAASACINDREVIQAEKEFKSRYLEQPAPAPEYQPEESPSRLLTFSGAGVALLAGAFGLGLVRSRRS